MLRLYLLSFLFFSSYGNAQTLAITHAGFQWDESGKAKIGVDWVIGWAVSERKPIIYLKDGADPSWYTNYQNPTEVIDTPDGSHQFEVEDEALILVGGYMYNCLQISLIDFISFKDFSNEKGFTIHFPIDSIYAPGLSFDREAVTVLDRVREFELAKILTYEERLRFNHSYQFYKPDLIDWALWGWSHRPGKSLFAHKQLSLDEFKFSLYVDEVIKKTIGTGAKEVHLKFWTSTHKMVKYITIPGARF